MKKEKDNIKFSTENSIFKSRRTISGDLIFSLVIVVTITSIFITSLNFWIISSKAKRIFESKANEYLHYLKDSLELPIWTFDEQTVEKICDSFFKNDTIAQLRVKNYLGNMLFEKDKDDDTKLVKKTGQVIHNGNVLGSIEIALTLRHYKENNFQLFKSGMINILATIIVIIFATKILLKLFITKPFDYLNDRINRIAEGDYEYGIKKYRQREIETIISKFNEMAEKVRNREQSLSEINTKLEREIEEREEAEEALSRSEEKYRLLADNVTDVIWVRDMNLSLTYISPSIMQQQGYTIEEAIARPIEKTITPDSLKLVSGVFTEELEIESNKQKDLYRFRTIEIEVICKDGSTIWTEVKMSFLRDHDDKPTGIIGVTRDITERKRFEVQLQQAHKMEAVGTLAGGIAHDFNNILGIILGNTELAMDDVEKGTLLENNLQEIYTAGKRARDLVKQILAFARQSDEELKPIQVAKIAKEALKLVRSTIPTTIEIRQNLESDALVMANPTQVHQIFMNLCANAAQAMEDAGGILEVGLMEVELDDSSPQVQSGVKAGHYQKITVSDNGAGISPDVINSIFEPYFTTKKVGEGTGMGLALVHGIVESYGGKITVKSELGKGTVFTVFLPKTKKRDVYRPYEEKDLPSGTERILLVDDELSIAKMGSQILERLGYHVTVSTSSVEALDLFRSRPSDFDLIITDMTMPNMTGDLLAMELIAFRPDIPVILCTGYSKKISDEKASHIGIKAFAYKPMVKADLAKTVRRVLDEAKASA